MDHRKRTREVQDEYWVKNMQEILVGKSRDKCIIIYSFNRIYLNHYSRYY